MAAAVAQVDIGADTGIGYAEGILPVQARTHAPGFGIRAGIGGLQGAHIEIATANIGLTPMAISAESRIQTFDLSQRNDAFQHQVTAVAFDLTVVDKILLGISVAKGEIDLRKAQVMPETDLGKTALA